MISVIIPNYNHSEYLEQRIESILNQTIQDFEIIILDDCSSDGSKNIIEKYRNNPKVTKIIYNSNNSGSTFKQWKLGLQIATFPLIWIAESDDFSHPLFLETALKTFEMIPDLTLFFCNSLVVDQDGSSLNKDTSSYGSTFTPNLFTDNFYMPGKEFIFKILSNKNMIQNASAVVFKKEHALSSVAETLNYKLCGDWLFWILLLMNGKIFYSNKKLNYFRVSPNNTRHHNSMLKKKSRIYEEMQVLERTNNLIKLDKLFLSKRTEQLLKKWVKLFNFSQVFQLEFYKPTTLQLYKRQSYLFLIFGLFAKNK